MSRTELVLTLWTGGAGVGMGRSPPPGTSPGEGTAGASIDKALASSGILPADNRRELADAVARLLPSVSSLSAQISPVFLEKDDIAFLRTVHLKSSTRYQATNVTVASAAGGF